jgi:hypothetical protein
MTGIGTALISDHQICVFGKIIGDFPLPFVPPLRPDDG